MPVAQSKYLLSLISLFITAIIWGGAFVTQRTAMEHLGPFGFNGCRFLIGAFFLIAVRSLFQSTFRSGTETGFSKITDSQNVKFGIALGALLFAGASLQQIGVVSTTAGKAGFITGLYIAIIPVLLSLFYRRKSPLQSWLGVFAATAGLYLLSINSDFSISTGDFWVLLSAIAFALHFIYIERWGAGCDPIVLAIWQFLLTGVASLVLAFGIETIDPPRIFAAWRELSYTGFLSVGVGYTAQLVAQKHISPVIAGVVLGLESVFAALAGGLFLGEVLTPRQLLGCILTFLGCLVCQIPSAAPKKAEGPSLQKN